MLIFGEYRPVSGYDNKLFCKNYCRLREKYHPDHIDNTREQVAKYIRLRLDVFLDLFDKGMIDNQPVDMDNCRNLVKLMDAVVVKLNGGTDEDLAALDEPESDSDTEMPEHKSPKRKVGSSLNLLYSKGVSHSAKCLSD